MAELDCVEPDAAVAEAEARVAAARAQVDAARALAEALGFQQEAAEGQARSQRAVAGSVEVQQRNAARQSNRAVRLEADDAVTQVARETAETASEDLAQRVTAGKAAADAASRTARAAAMQAHASREQTRAAERQVEAGEAALERVKAIQAECRITAPAPGMVTIRAREPGEVLLPGSILFEITRSDDTRVTFFIPNRSLGSAAPGIQVRVSADAWPDRRFTGTIVAVSPEAEFTPRTVQTRSDRDRLVYAVEATLENGEGLLRPGMPVDVEIVPASPDDPAP
jgi:HlyD family secretion protein